MSGGGFSGRSLSRDDRCVLPAVPEVQVKRSRPSQAGDVRGLGPHLRSVSGASDFEHLHTAPAPPPVPLPKPSDPLGNCLQLWESLWSPDNVVLLCPRLCDDCVQSVVLNLVLGVSKSKFFLCNTSDLDMGWGINPSSLWSKLTPSEPSFPASEGFLTQPLALDDQDR